MDIWSITGTLITDGEGSYDPRIYDDRLPPGLKGTTNDGKLYIMRHHLVEATLAKMRGRVGLQRHQPPSYVWNGAGRMQKDPDTQVRSAIELIFRRLAELETIHAASISLVEDGVEMPLVGGPRGNYGGLCPCMMPFTVS